MATIMGLLHSLKFFHNGIDRVFCITEEHGGLRLVEQRIINASVARAHGTLGDDDGVGFCHIQNGHAIDG